MSGESLAAQRCQGLQRGRFGCGWSGNDQKGAWDKWRDLPGRQDRGPAGVRASIRARKPGNAGGAKGRRKTKGSESAYRINHSARLPYGSHTESSTSLRNPTDCLGEQPGDGPVARRHAMLGPILCLALVLAERSLLFGGHSSIGEPYARDPHVRFGGRGGFHPRPYPNQVGQSLVFVGAMLASSLAPRAASRNQTTKPLILAPFRPDPISAPFSDAHF